MPKGAEYQIAWNERDQAYVLRHAPFSFPLTNDTLQYWLNLIEAFHFQAASGDGITVRKETKQRGTAYWYAYRRVDGKLRKKYLGETSKVNLALLETVARAFVASSEFEPATSKQQSQPPPRRPVFHFAKTLESALSIFGFASIPTKGALVTRYRELVKQHHPDKGGLHQDMVAINLSYDLLKRYTF